MSWAYNNNAGQRPTQHGEYAAIMPNRNFYRRRQGQPGPGSPISPPRPPPYLRDDRAAANPSPTPWQGRFNPNIGHQQRLQVSAYRTHEQAFHRQHLEHQHQLQQLRQQHYVQQVRQSPHLLQYHSPGTVHQHLPLPPLNRRSGQVSIVHSPHVETASLNQPTTAARDVRPALRRRGQDFPLAESYGGIQLLSPEIDLSSNSDFLDHMTRMEASWGFPPDTWYPRAMAWLESNEKYQRPPSDVVEGTGFLAEIENGMSWDRGSIDEGTVSEGSEADMLVSSTKADVETATDGHEEGAAAGVAVDQSTRALPGGTPAPNPQQRKRQASLQSLDFGDVMAAGENDWEHELAALP